MSTLGENLRNLREEAELSLKKLSKITKIQEKYLLRLEDNEFDKLPKPVYIKGFIKKYVNACGGDAEEFILQFKRENEEFIQLDYEDRLSQIEPSLFVITSKNIISVVVLIAVVALGVFFYFNQKLVSQTPQVEVTIPADFNIVTEESTVFISGQTRNTEKVFINGSEVSLNADGRFEFTYSLSEGLNTIIIKALSSAGIEVETARKVLKL